MALDPNVILAGAPTTPPVTPLLSSDQLATAAANRATAQARLDALKQQRQALIDQAAGRAAFSAALQQRVDPSTGVPDVDAAINDIYPQYPTFAQTMKTTVDASRQKEAATQKQTNENNGWALDHLINIGRTVQNADQYQTWRQLGIASLKDPDEQKQFANMAPEQVPDEQLPEVMGKLNSGLLTAQQALEAQQKSLDLYTSGKGLDAYASRMMLAATPQARQQAKQDAVAMGIPKADRAIVDAVDINDPDFAAKMKAILAQSAKPVEVQAGGSLVSPVTGQALMTAPNPITPYQDAELAIRNADLALAQKREAREATQAVSDKSYNANKTRIDALRKTADTTLDNFAGLDNLINQRTPQADALIAPKLLSVTVGGTGTGLRMNQAEINQVVGGRTNWESLQAALNKWSLDPNHAPSITDAQRQQIRALAASVAAKAQSKVQIIQQADADLLDAKTPDEQRRIVAKAQKDVEDVSAAAPATSATGTVRVRGPKGETGTATAGKPLPPGWTVVP